MPFPFRLSKRTLRWALKRSLKRLRSEQVDLYQMHFPLPPFSVETWMEAMADAVEVGLIRTVGVSNYDVSQMEHAHNALAKRGLKLASNQVFYSLLHRTPEFSGLLQACRDMNVTLIAYSPLEKGVLTGKYTSENPPPGARQRIYKREYLAQVQSLLQLIRNIGAAHGGKSEAQIALNWIICKGAVPIPGAKNARQAISNAGALGWRLSDDEVAALDAASFALR